MGLFGTKHKQSDARLHQLLEDVCALADGEALEPELCAEIGRRYAEAIEPIADVRGSATYRRRVIAVEVRRALEELAG